MKKALHVLHLEDNRDDAELIHEMLKAADWTLDVTVVENGTDFNKELKKGGWDIIFSDNTLPSFNGIAALNMARQMSPTTPFIFVSGTLGEEIAIESLKQGATDYVLKHRLAKLPHAVERALREIQERKERALLEEQFRQSQKMEAIGALADGIAHDFNNILIAISGFCDLMLEDMSSENPHYSQAAEIKKASRLATALTQQLLTFSRKQESQTTELNLNTVIEGAATMLRQIVQKGVRLNVNLAPHLPSIQADATQIEQVLLNLAVNARDAMPKGGTLTVETSQATLEKEPQGKYVVLSVKDSGCGMPSEIKEHIFEPFFTTKEKGKGTGLGLSTVYSIVTQFKGFIVVESEVNKGTTFKIYFPCAV